MIILLKTHNFRMERGIEKQVLTDEERKIFLLYMEYQFHSLANPSKNYNFPFLRRWVYMFIVFAVIYSIRRDVKRNFGYPFQVDSKLVNDVIIRFYGNWNL